MGRTPEAEFPFCAWAGRPGHCLLMLQVGSMETGSQMQTSVQQQLGGAEEAGLDWR